MSARVASSAVTESAELMRAYEESEKDFRIQQARIGCILVLICMPLGSGLDWFVYPGHLVSFLIFGRLLCDLAVAPLYLILGSRFARERLNAIGLIWPLLPAVAISWMIYATEGSTSPYYAGLNLVLIVACQLMPYTLKEAAVVCGTTLLLYLLACVGHARTTHIVVNASTIYNNLYFIAITTLICLCSSHYTSLRRLRDFKLRQELDERNHRLAELDRLKSEFFANISHELRTPLALILAPTDQLLSDRATLTDELASTLAIIRQNALRLLKLINDLLEIVRLDERPGPKRRENIDLAGFVRATVDSMRHLATQKHLKLAYVGSSSPVLLSVDSSAIEKVVLNLLTNAIKFTPPGGAITVDLQCENHDALLTFQDSGIGIPAKDLPHIFDRFRQVDGSSTRRFQGVGIGLALARELIQEHGGTLTATSEEGKGATFTVRLPIESNLSPVVIPASDNADPVVRLYQEADRLIVNPHSPLERDELSGVTGQGTKTILVVEDEPDLRKFVVSLLCSSYSVRQAADGLRGLNAVKAHRPELVLVDLMLPEMDGLSVCKEIKCDPDLRQTKVVLITARTDEQSKLTALNYGADDFLQKPFSTSELTTRVANLMRAAELEQELRNRNAELALTIQKLQETEVQLVQSEKMNAVGRLSGGILHEINNPLNAALMALHLARQKNPTDSVAEYLSELETALKRIRTVTTDLRSFAHPNHDVADERFTIESALSAAERMLAHDLGDLSIRRENIGDSLVRGSKNQITHVFINLLSNAAMAVRAAGERTPAVVVRTRVDQNRLVTTVQDNGVGIPEINLTRVTEPFFTTRDVGQGMGLGLSICHTIIRNHGGTLRIESSEGQWTCVSFDLSLDVPEMTA